MLNKEISNRDLDKKESSNATLFCFMVHFYGLRRNRALDLLADRELCSESLKRLSHHELNHTPPVGIVEIVHLLVFVRCLIRSHGVCGLLFIIFFCLS